MSSRPLFVKRSRLSYRLILWTTPVLIFILAVAGLKVKRHEALALWRPPAESAGAIHVSTSPAKQSVESSGNSGQKIQPESPPAQAIAALPTGGGQTTSVVQGSPGIIDGASDELKSALNQWSTAWRTQDVPIYLDMYAADFLVPQGMSRHNWAQLRSARIMGKRKIQHDMQNVQIDLQGWTATVKFTQLYADQRTAITDKKTMQWVFREGRWLIIREATD